MNTKSYFSLKTFSYGGKIVFFVVLCGFLVMSLIYFACNRSATSLYKVMFNSPPPKSVKFKNSQDIYIMDCCLWLHFKIDSLDLNNLLKEGFTQEKLWLDSNNTPPEAKSWWHPDKLGSNALFYTKEKENSKLELYTNVSKNEVYAVYYIEFYH